MNQYVWIAIVIGGIIGGIGIGYAVFMNTYNPYATMMQPQFFNEMMSRNPQFAGQYMGYMMQNPQYMNQWFSQNPQFYGQWMGGMMNDQYARQQMYSGMFGNPQYRQEMSAYLAQNPQTMYDWCSTMMNNPQVMQTIMNNPQHLQLMQKMMGNLTATGMGNMMKIKP